MTVVAAVPSLRSLPRCHAGSPGVSLTKSPPTGLGGVMTMGCVDGGGDLATAETLKPACPGLPTAA